MQHSHDTRSRIIQAAGEIFAEHGFHAATIRKISARAKVNVAAVNYYFGGKQQLYEEALRQVFLYRGDVLDAPDTELADRGDGASASLSAEERLRRRVRLFLEVGLDPKRPAWHRGIHARELTQPSPAMKRMVHDIIARRFHRLRGIVREITGPDIDDATLDLCTFSILAQCLFYLRGRFVLPMLRPDWRLDMNTIDVLAEHITRFSLQALRGYGGRSEPRSDGASAEVRTPCRNGKEPVP